MMCYRVIRLEEVFGMVILKADPSLDKVYRKMIETAKEGVDWTGFFAVNKNMEIL